MKKSQANSGKDVFEMDTGDILVLKGDENSLLAHE